MKPFSSEVYHIDNFIEYSFIAGISQSNLKQSECPYTPECLFSYPFIESNIFEGIIEFVFPIGIEPLTKNSLEDEEITYFNSFVLTNEKGKHSYIYELKFYEKINNLKTPIAICLNSLINDTDSFKTLLHEIYMIIISDLSFDSKQIELLHYFMFIHSIKVPPMHSLLTLNMKFLSVDFYFNSRSELPTVSNDSNINILFSVLEMSKIIKLWLSVLFEKKIIIYGDKPYILHAVIDAITKLIFPLSYPYNIISCLPITHLELLELPFPYIIGVLSSTITIDKLQVTYPDHCIVDLIPGHIYSSKIPHLPRDEEISIKRQIQFVRNPELFENNQIFKTDKKFLNSECIDPNMNLSTNIKLIFFRIMKKILQNYDKHISNNSFDYEAFLSTIPNETMRNIWEVIVKTNLFNHFYFNENYLDDDNYTKIFNEILLNKEDKMTIDNAFRIQINLMKLDQRKIMGRIRQYDLDDNNKTFEKIFLGYSNEQKYDYNNNNSNSSNGNYNQRKTLINNTNRNSIFNANDSFVSDCYDNNNNNNHFQKAQSIMQGNQINPINELFDFNPTSFLVSSIRDTNYKNIYKKIPENKFRFYGNDGFIGFIKTLFEKCIAKEKKLHEIIIQCDLINDIKIIEKNHIRLKSHRMSDSMNMSRGMSMNQMDYIDCLSKSSEEYDENKQNYSEKRVTCYDDKSLLFKITTFNTIKDKKMLQKKKLSDNFLSNWKMDMQRISVTNDKPISININYTSKNTMAQVYLFFAFNLENMHLTIDSKERILSYYHQAYEFDDINFPYYHYSTYVKKFCSINQLEDLKEKIQGNNLRRVIDFILFTFRRKMNTITSKTPEKLQLKQISTTEIKPFDISIDQSKIPRTTISRHHNSFGFNKQKTVDYEEISKQMKKERYQRKIPFQVELQLPIKKLISVKINTDLRASGKNHTNNVARISGPFQMPSSIISFTTPQVINKIKKIYTRSDALTLIHKISTLLYQLIQKAGYEIKAIYSYDASFIEIQDLIHRLQRVNLAKLATIKEKHVFWLNSFNFLLIYSIIYSQFKPNVFKDWSLLLMNCKFNIGGYEMSLYEIEHLILHCENIHKVPISFTDSLMQKFTLEEHDPLINCALYLPIEDNIMIVSPYTLEDFHNQKEKIIRQMLKKYISFSNETNILSVSSYLISFYPSFLNSTYELYSNYMEKDIYVIFKEKRYIQANITTTKWETIFK